jgi:arginine exporter protein ArgO
VGDAVVAGILAGYGIAIPVGAIGVLIVGLAARHRFPTGAGAGLGAAAADGIYATLAVLGGAAAAKAIAPAATPLRWIAALVLLAIASRTALLAIRHYRDPASVPARGALMTSPSRAFLGVLGLTLLNPATVIYFVALVVGGRATSSLTPATGIAFVAAAFLASASWQLFLAGGGSLIGRVLTGPRGRIVTAVVSSVVIGFLAIQLMVSA